MFPLRLALCLFLISGPALGSVQRIADRIYYGGDIITVDDAVPNATAIAVQDSRIIGVGTLADIVRLRGARTELIDLEGRTLAPGFIDAHGHLSRAGLQAISANLMPPPNGHGGSAAGIVEILRSWTHEAAPARQFGLILGYGYDDAQFADGQRLTRHGLDEVSAHLPVVAVHHSGTRGVFNTRALMLAGIGATPPGTDGLLAGEAHYRALRRVLETLGQENVTPLIDAAQQLYIRFGHTTAQDSAPGSRALAAYRRLAVGGRLKIDVIAYPGPLFEGSMSQTMSPFRSRTYLNGFRIGGIMVHPSGVPPTTIARPLRTRFREPDLEAGDVMHTGGLKDGEVVAILAAAFRKRRQVIADPPGPQAIGRFMAAVRAAATAVPGAGRRPVMVVPVHMDLPPRTLHQIRELGIMPVLHGFPSSATDRSASGESRVPMIGALMAYEIPFTAAHGAPAARPDILHILTETAGWAPGGSPVRTAALKSVTLWAARQYSEENAKGSITVGKLADLVILSANPLAAKPEALANIHVMETIKDGETIFVREDDEFSFACADSAACFTGLTTALSQAGTAPPGERSRPPKGRSASLYE